MAVFATLVASVAHTIGGGAPPGLVALLVALAFSIPLAVALTGARAQLARTAVSALVAQAALHVTYGMGGAAPLGHATHLGHRDGVALAASPTSAVDHGTAWMPIAHVVAAGLTLAALLLTDRVVHAIGGTMGMLVRRLAMIPVSVIAPSLRVPVDAARPRFAAVLLATGLGSRGPPVESAAA
ncbi:hypothetical protein AVP42_02593 [Agromyces sp. NDB4Y10]|uniref:hypothetical protein n=1 Tax=Agromyces sp. NDB4Y10 TaxID=1775951 RepID=UPI0007B1B76B|nr:hypothetical protein [Agromyces sp. NDB4Y10]KZE92439.1 hypothetical protein AVP42_02593 [Agromyces sp. NDB4Y10]